MGQWSLRWLSTRPYGPGDGVFCVLPYQPGQPEREVAQSTAVADAAAAGLR
jgi:hypothetical protein